MWRFKSAFSIPLYPIWVGNAKYSIIFKKIAHHWLIHDSVYPISLWACEHMRAGATSHSFDICNTHGHWQHWMGSVVIQYLLTFSFTELCFLGSSTKTLKLSLRQSNKKDKKKLWNIKLKGKGRKSKAFAL